MSQASLRVLLVDDEEMAADILQRILDRAVPGAELVWESSPARAGDVASDGSWSLIVVDLMFGLSTPGVDIVRRIYGILGGITPIVVLTQLELTADEQQECLAAGATDVLTKWPSSGRFQDLLHGWLAPQDCWSGAGNSPSSGD